MEYAEEPPRFGEEDGGGVGRVPNDAQKVSESITVGQSAQFFSGSSRPSPLYSGLLTKLNICCIIT